jgi:hypothetical protein
MLILVQYQVCQTILQYPLHGILKRGTFKIVTPWFVVGEDTDHGSPPWSVFTRQRQF